MKTVFYSLFLGLFYLAVSCSTSNELVVKEKNEKPIEVKKAIIDTFPAQARLNYNIESVRVNENVISIEVNFLGACENQEFNLIGRDEFKDGSLPERKIKLVPSEISRGCKEWLNKTVHFDIEDFAVVKEDGFHTILLLDGYAEYISFYYRGF